ncbi:MAG: voltage-gated potassium channel [Parasphingorhabdus sp.]|jgi:voltage-gated potassium channel
MTQPATYLPSVVFLVFRRLRAPLIVLIIVYAISILGFTLVPGQDDQGNEWQMDFFHATYFVSYMGSTIGFGELPYPFTGAQRLWTLFTIYATVFAWLYAIGTLISLMQDRALQTAIGRIRSQSQIRRLKEPFYLICGYGDVGRLITRLLAETGIRTVVIEENEQSLNRLKLEDISFTVPAFCADATIAENLLLGGLMHQLCRGVIAVTGDEQENLKIAIASKLLNPQLPLICRTITDDTAANMHSFGTDHIVNPFNTFAWHFGLAFSSPGLHLLNDWLSKTEYQKLNEPVFPPKGRWILCGYGKFGKVMEKHLVRQGNTVTIIDINPTLSGAPADSIIGRGTEAETLHQASVNEAVGVIAGTDHDANNLSIVVTAKELNKQLFCVARQNLNHNNALFDAANINMVLNQNRVIASRVISLLTTQLTTDFLRMANEQSAQWSNILISRIAGVVDSTAPSTWVMKIGPADMPAVLDALNSAQVVKIKHLLAQPSNRKNSVDSIVLMLRRGKSNSIIPDPNTALKPGDQILFCGDKEAKSTISRSTGNQNLMNYILTGTNRPVGTFWKWVSKT